jgi:murein peptide amidase A
MRRLALAACVAGLGLVAAGPGSAVAGRSLTSRIGRSAGGRPLRVNAFGNPDVARKVLVVGCIHGTECAGVAIARQVMDGCWPVGADVWAVPDLNPDGYRLGTRVNGRGVDLNRNFPAGWRTIGARGDPEYEGPRPFSEPESRAARDLIERLRPAVTIWYHQGQGPLVRAWGASVHAARQYARRSGLPFRRLRWPAGTAPHWQNVRYPGTSSFVVELPDGRLSPAQAMRHAEAVLALARYRGGDAREMGPSVQGGR